MLRLGGGSPCGADPPCPVSGSRLFDAAVVAAVGGIVADGAAVAAVGDVAAAGAAVEEAAGPGAVAGAGALALTPP